MVGSGRRWRVVLARVVIASVLATIAIGAGLAAQTPATPQATFRGGTDLVQVDVSVVDDKRRPVRGLAASDFTVLEDGQPRAIQAFAEVALQDRIRAEDAAWTRDVPADVTSNRVSSDEGRLVVILMDRSIPLGEPTLAARRIAHAVLDQLGPGDLAAVVSTSHSGVQNLTADRTRLARAIDRGDPSTDISDDAKEIEIEVFALTGRTWGPLNDPRCACGLCVLEAVTRIAEAVQSSTGRRKLLFFIGSDMVLQDAGSADGARQDIGCGGRLRDAREAMTRAVDRANLTVHALDPLGLPVGSVVSRASSPVRAGAAASGANSSGPGAMMRRHDALAFPPDRTGGRAVFMAAPERAVPSLFRESESYYLLGFLPGTSANDGRFHRITVTTTRRGVHVHARSGYSRPVARAVDQQATGGSALAAPVQEALTGLLPAGGTPLDLSVAAFAGTDRSKAAITLTVGLDAGSLRPEASGAVPLELTASAFDARGRLQGLARQAITLTAPADVSGTRRLDVLSRLDLPPGDYEIRVALSGAIRPASVFNYVTVPAFRDAPLSLSNLVVTPPAGIIVAPPDFLSSWLPIVPSTQRCLPGATR